MPRRDYVWYLDNFRYTDGSHQVTPRRHLETNPEIEPTPEEQARGFALFHRHWMDLVFPTSIPTADHQVAAITDSQANRQAPRKALKGGTISRNPSRGNGIRRSVKGSPMESQNDRTWPTFSVTTKARPTRLWSEVRYPRRHQPSGARKTATHPG